MGSAGLHLFEVVVGALLVLLGVGTVGGWIGQTAPSSRWQAPSLIGAGDTALGVALLLFGLLSHYLWAVVISLAAFAVGAICVITWVVKGAARRADDEFGS
jgi:predicted MFS family arabinose efflux permease